MEDTEQLRETNEPTLPKIHVVKNTKCRWQMRQLTTLLFPCTPTACHPRGVHACEEIAKTHTIVLNFGNLCEVHNILMPHLVATIRIRLFMDSVGNVNNHKFNKN